MMRHELHKIILDRLFARVNRELGRPLKEYEIHRFLNQNRGNIQRIIAKAETDIDKQIAKFLKNIKH